jgi:hypothetical protein
VKTTDRKKEKQLCSLTLLRQRARFNRQRQPAACKGRERNKKEHRERETDRQTDRERWKVRAWDIGCERKKWMSQKK